MNEISFEWDEIKNTSALYLHAKPQKMKKSNISQEVINMNEEYNFTGAKKNPYAKKLKRQITININNETVDYFRQMAEQTGIPYQTLINMYLADCAQNKRQINITWN